MSIYSLDGAEPEIAGSAYVAESASVIGRVILAEKTSVWSNAVLRADNEPISIGEGSNVQEGAVLHNDKGYPLVVGAGVSVGHQATLHGCTVGDGSLIGIHAVVLNGAVIGKECLVGASSLVTESKVFPDRTLIMGAPAKAVRELTELEVLGLRANAKDYVAKAAMYKAQIVVIKRPLESDPP